MNKQTNTNGVSDSIRQSFLRHGWSFDMGKLDNETKKQILCSGFNEEKIYTILKERKVG